MTTVYTFMKSPFGRILVAVSDAGLVRVGIGERIERFVGRDWRLDAGLDCDATRQLDEYFAGERRGFDLATAATGTPFRIRVWHALKDIPYGETLAYGEVANRIGSPSASRAVGLACGSNPLPIVVPCHRVVGVGGRLVGFGGGLEMKRAMLALERARSVPVPIAGGLGF